VLPAEEVAAPRARATTLRLGLLALAVALAAVVVVFVVRPTPGAMRGRVDDVRAWVDSAGVVAPLAFIAVSALLTTLMFPGPILAGASGLLFGTALGFPVSLTAAVLGASLAFVISRYVAGDAIEQLAGPRLRSAEALVSRRGFVSVLYARIAPGVPYTLVNYAAGLTRIRLVVFAGATALGAAPRAFAYTALGGSIGNLRSPEAAGAVSVLVGMGLIGIGLLVRERRASLKRR
jgi:uncharacterized membrane protein YdjX (TVP38/TMEM64 family)